MKIEQFKNSNNSKIEAIPKFKKFWNSKNIKIQTIPKSNISKIQAIPFRSFHSFHSDTKKSNDSEISTIPKFRKLKISTIPKFKKLKISNNFKIQTILKKLEQFENSDNSKIQVFPEFRQFQNSNNSKIRIIENFSKIQRIHVELLNNRNIRNLSPTWIPTSKRVYWDFLTAGISESTRLSRARNAFTSDFQRDREEDRSSEVGSDVLVEDDSINTESESSSPSVVDIAAITGSCLATVIIISTMASFGFIMYRYKQTQINKQNMFSNSTNFTNLCFIFCRRRRYLNPPQTLNSDKCSNPDSSGYIDDSTIRVSNSVWAKKILIELFDLFYLGF